MAKSTRNYVVSGLPKRFLQRNQAEKMEPYCQQKAQDDNICQLVSARKIQAACLENYSHSPNRRFKSQILCFAEVKDAYLVIMRYFPTVVLKLASLLRMRKSAAH